MSEKQDSKKITKTTVSKKQWINKYFDNSPHQQQTKKRKNKKTKKLKNSQKPRFIADKQIPQLQTDNHNSEIDLNNKDINRVDFTDQIIYEADS